MPLQRTTWLRRYGTSLTLLPSHDLDAGVFGVLEQYSGGLGVESASGGLADWIENRELHEGGKEEALGRILDCHPLPVGTSLRPQTWLGSSGCGTRQCDDDADGMVA